MDVFETRQHRSSSSMCTLQARTARRRSSNRIYLVVLQGMAMRGGAVVAVAVAVFEVRVPVVLVTVLHGRRQRPVANVTQRRLHMHTHTP